MRGLHLLLQHESLIRTFTGEVKQASYCISRSYLWHYNRQIQALTWKASEEGSSVASTKSRRPFPGFLHVRVLRTTAATMYLVRSQNNKY
ncbi:hypothetical protein C5167_023342 [Papaver somniferum]|uniref:Uncharacterized protein n=1 Tax=Papaver somniferum TaxID=3469 RepID=A0A4Y7JP59_PAPSO|nr:hypothetical protein C5167_023342 [Papaver somniferum]